MCCVVIVIPFYAEAIHYAATNLILIKITLNERKMFYFLSNLTSITIKPVVKQCHRTGT